MTDDHPEVLRIHGYEVDLERLTYAVVVVMSVLVAFGGWQQLSYLAAALVVVAPVVALAIAHAFSEVLHEHAIHKRPLTAQEWRYTAWRQLQLLLAAVPPLIVLTIGRAASIEGHNVVAVALSTSVVTLIVLAAIASWRAGYRGWRWALASLTGGVIGLCVIFLQVFLKPK